MTESNWKAASVAAMVALTGVLAYHLFVPQPQPAANVLKRRAEVKKLESEVEKLREQVTADRKSVESKVWKEAGDQLGAEAMKTISNYAAQSKLKVIAFRPQRSQDDANLTRFGYLAALDGPFPNVMQFISSIESNANKLALSSVQITSVDGASDRVSASVSVVAFRQKEVQK